MDDFQVLNHRVLRVVNHQLQHGFLAGFDFLRFACYHQRGLTMPAMFGVRVLLLLAMVAMRLLRPALSVGVPLRIVCFEDRHDKLLARLALHELDVVISDGPMPVGSGLKAFNHVLGECGISFFAGRKIAERLRGRFPKNLDGAPFLLPTTDSTLRRSLDTWFDAQGIRPHVVGEFEDSALLKAFGHDGAGVFAAPTVIAREIVKQHGVRVLGRSEAVRERFYAISAERRLRHPAVVALTEAARDRMFGSENA